MASSIFRSCRSVSPRPRIALPSWRRSPSCRKSAIACANWTIALSVRPSRARARPGVWWAAARVAGAIRSRASTWAPNSTAREKGPLSCNTPQAARYAPTAVSPCALSIALRQATTRLSTSCANARRRLSPRAGTAFRPLRSCRRQQSASRDAARCGRISMAIRIEPGRGVFVNAQVHPEIRFVEREAALLAPARSLEASSCRGVPERRPSPAARRARIRLRQQRQRLLLQQATSWVYILV